jgi:peptide-methionine (S)-S-oxide reductase
MKQKETAYFAGGCFWCITPAFRELPGVYDVVSGFSGGEEEDPDYLDVKYQRTGHRETIRIDYDPDQVEFRQLMDIFLGSVDPFDADGQFIDRGFSYTLAVYYICESQKAAAQARIAELEQTSGRKAYVPVEPFRSFYAAGEEHQDYYRKNPEAFRRELIESGRLKE